MLQGSIGSRQCYEGGSAPAENCDVVQIRETRYNASTLALLLYTYISVPFIWIAFSMLSSVKYIIRYIPINCIDGKHYPKFSNLRRPEKNTSRCLCKAI